MKFTLTFKTPDVLDQLEGELEETKAREFADHWIKYGEYVTIDFDTTTETVEVRKVTQ